MDFDPTIGIEENNNIQVGSVFPNPTNEEAMLTNLQMHLF